MNCKHVTDLVCDYISDCLTPSARRELEAHLAVCPACRAEVADAENMVSCLATLSAGRAPVDCWSAVRRQIVARESRWSGWLHWVRPAFAVPAAAVAALLLVVVLLWPFHAPKPSAPQAVPASEYARYVTEHSRFQRQQAFTDPDVTFIAAEFEKARVVSASSTRP